MRGSDFAQKAGLDNLVRPLAEGEFEQIRELARRTFGLDLREGKQDLVAARLQRLLQAGNFHSYQEYYRHVLSDSTGEALMTLIDALATNHTAFYREPDHFDFLKQNVLSDLGRRPSVDIWSAACSTGEEVWTLVLLVHDALPGAKVRVIGSDISRRALQFAARAVYPADRVRLLPRGLAGMRVHTRRRRSRFLHRQTGYSGASHIPPAEPHRAFPLAGLLPYHFLPQCHDLLRSINPTQGRRQLERQPGSRRLPVCGPCRKPFYYPAWSGICAAGRLSQAVFETGTHVEREIVVAMADCRVSADPRRLEQSGRKRELQAAVSQRGELTWRTAY